MRLRQRKTEPAKSGSTGKLHYRAERDGETVEGTGGYRYIGLLASGVLAFTPAVDEDDHPIYLAPSEVVSFRSDR